MNKKVYVWATLPLLLLLACQNTPTPSKKGELSPLVPANESSLMENLTPICFEQLKKLPGLYQENKLQEICGEAHKLSACVSVEGRPIYHFEKRVSREGQLKILVLSIVHGDEPISGSVTRAWLERLTEMSPRNSWRIIPILNPDGLLKKTRTNARGVDINRNFPSQNWHKEVQNYWIKVHKKNKRLFPGEASASEPETKCVLDHLSEFKPDFIIAIHTPLGVLDFDGPPIKVDPKDVATFFPWMRLGNYPGSLGRYMWRDNHTPVLTIELRGPQFLKNMEQIDRLQDLSGMIALLAKQKTKELQPTSKASLE